MDLKKTFVIACEVFKPEIDFLIETNNYDRLETIYLEHGLHRTPDELKIVLQQTIDQIEEEYQVEKILLGFGFCGRGLYEVTSKKAVLIVPRVHDCIPVLLGTGPENEVRPPEYTTTFWLTPGWATYYKYKHIKRKEDLYAQYLADFDEDCANYLMQIEDAWHEQYEAACQIEVEGFNPPEFLEQCEFIANDINVPLTKTKGSLSYIIELLEGGENQKNFFHLKPGITIDINGEGMLDIRAI